MILCPSLGSLERPTGINSKASCLLLNHGVDFRQESGEIAVAMFLCEMAERNRRWVAAAIRAHAVGGQNLERLREGNQQFSYCRMRINWLHAVLSPFQGLAEGTWVPPRPPQQPV